MRVADEHPFCSGEKLSNCKAAASLTRRIAREIDSESCGIETAGFLRASAKSSCASLLEMHGDAWRYVEMLGDLWRSPHRQTDRQGHESGLCRALHAHVRVHVRARARVRVRVHGIYVHAVRLARRRCMEMHGDT